MCSLRRERRRRDLPHQGEPTCSVDLDIVKAALVCQSLILEPSRLSENMAEAIALAGIVKET